MKFQRKQRVKGKTVKHYKEWYDETGQYRISWRDEVYDVEVIAGFFACVKCVRSLDDMTEYWGFANKRALYRTLKAAQNACETGEKLWKQVMSIEGRDKVSQVRNLETRAMIGTGKAAYSAFSDIPVWVIKKNNPRLLEILKPC